MLLIASPDTSSHLCPHGIFLGAFTTPALHSHSIHWVKYTDLPSLILISTWRMPYWRGGEWGWGVWSRGMRKGHDFCQEEHVTATRCSDEKAAQIELFLPSMYLHVMKLLRCFAATSSLPGHSQTSSPWKPSKMELTQPASKAQHSLTHSSSSRFSPVLLGILFCVGML